MENDHREVANGSFHLLWVPYAQDLSLKVLCETFCLFLYDKLLVAYLLDVSSGLCLSPNFFTYACLIVLSMVCWRMMMHNPHMYVYLVESSLVPGRHQMCQLY